MPTGMDRREVPQDNLAGQQDITPVTISGPGLQSPTPLRGADTSTSAQIAQQLTKWGGGKLAEAADKKHKRDMMDGQVAHQQGETFEAVEMGGNKWALEGYRLMDAQTISSTMLAAQREEIRQVGYSLTPDQYRSQLGDRLEAMTEGLDDRTADLVREQFASQTPTLVADHTTAHLSHQEQQNFDSLERSIEVVSRDPTATDQLVDFARGGADSASEGLSDGRRQAATVAGVTRAFDNDNPLAFAALSKEGLLGDNLSTAEQNSIKAAKSRFEQRRRTERNDALMIGQDDILDRVKSGETPYDVAAEEYSTLLADHGIEMTRAEAGALYSTAEAGETVSRATRGALLEEAGLRGDIDTQANIILDSLTVTESGGRAGAFRKNDDGRTFGGLVQMGQDRLTDWSNATGGSTMTPSQYANLSKPRQLAIARWHIKDLIQQANATGAIGSTINGVTVTLSGLVAVGHLGGARGMKKFVSTNGVYNPDDGQAIDGRKGKGTTLTDYLSKHGSGEMQELMSPNARLEWAQENLAETKEALNMETYSAMQPALAALEDDFISGAIKQDQYEEQTDALYEQYDVAVDTSAVNNRVATIRSANTARAAEAKTASDEAYTLAQEAADANITPLTLAWEAAMDDPSLSNAERLAASKEYTAARTAVLNEHGIEEIDRGAGPLHSEMTTRMLEAQKAARKHRKDGTIIANAESAGTVGTLSKELQQRALEDNEKRVNKEVAEDIHATPAEVGAALRQHTTDYIANNGIVDEAVQQVVNLAATGTTWIRKDGTANPDVVAGLHSFASIMAQNPGLAYEYVPDPEARGRMLAATYMVQTKFPGADVFSTVDLTDKDSPLTDAFHTAVEQVGLAIERPATPEQTAQRVQSATRLMERGNISNTWFGGVNATNAANALLPVGWGGRNRALLGSFDLADANAAFNVDASAVEEGFTTAVTDFIEEVMPHMPSTPQSGAVTMALDYARTRGAAIGSGFLMPKPGQPSIYAQMWPGAEVTNTAAPNTAVVEWMQDPETHKSHPVIEEWYKDNSTFDEGLRRASPFHTANPGQRVSPEFTVHYLNGTYRAMLPGYGSFALPLRDIGEHYNSNR